MSELNHPNEYEDDEIYEDDCDVLSGPFEEDDQYEEISCDEVDRVVGNLEELLEDVRSENVKAYLEEAMNGIYYLVYEALEDDDELESEAA